MELKKIIILLVALSLADTFYAQYFTVKPISFANESIQINEEIVEFSYETVSSVLTLRNSSDEKILLSATMVCEPEWYGGGSEADTLIPLDFHVFDGENEIDFSIENEGKRFTRYDSIEQRTNKESRISFVLPFNPMETKRLNIKYKNSTGYLTGVFDTGWRKTIKYIFHSASKQKLAIYIPNDKNLSVDEGFCFLDFILKANNNYLIENNIIRSYKNNNYEWVVTIPNEVIEIICRQDFFNPLGLGDYAPYVFLYKEAFSDLEDTVLIRFRDKNLSKELLSKSDLFTLSKRQLSILRNSFYARHGYNFKNKELREYFEANCREQGVEYKVNPKFSESVFNEVERKNIELIKEMENTKELMVLSDYLK